MVGAKEGEEMNDETLRGKLMNNLYDMKHDQVKHQEKNTRIEAEKESMEQLNKKPIEKYKEDKESFKSLGKGFLNKVNHEEDAAKAQSAKTQGNIAFKEKEWEKAEDYYTKAIHLDPYNHIHYSNRA